MGRGQKSYSDTIGQSKQGSRLPSGSYTRSRAHRPVLLNVSSLRTHVLPDPADSEPLWLLASAIQITQNCHHEPLTAHRDTGIPCLQFQGSQTSVVSVQTRPNSLSTLCPNRSGKAHNDTCRFPVSDMGECEGAVGRGRLAAAGPPLRGPGILTVPLRPHYTPWLPSAETPRKPDGPPTPNDTWEWD